MKNEKEYMILNRLNIPRTSIVDARRRNTYPHLTCVYKIPQALGVKMEDFFKNPEEITIEWLYDGERGQEFVEGIMAKEGKLYRPPSRIAGIIEDLAILDDEEISRFAKQIHVIAEDVRKGANEKNAI